MLMGFAESDPQAQAFVAAFREGLQKLGWAEGRRRSRRSGNPASLGVRHDRRDSVERSCYRRGRFLNMSGRICSGVSPVMYATV